MEDEHGAAGTDRARAGGRLLVPLAALGVAIAAVELGGWDLPLSDPFYDPASGGFPLRRHWLLGRVLHEGGQHLVVAAGLSLVAALVASWFVARLRPWRRDLAYLLLAVGFSTGAVSLLKSTTNRYCPWDMIRYGGSVPYTSLLEGTPEPFRDGRCFPAGHASGGFAWLGLYFVALSRGGRRPALWLVPGLVLGVVFGLTQQVRGAHFFSHNLWTVAICWGIAAALAPLLLPYVAGKPGSGPGQAHTR